MQKANFITKLFLEINDSLLGKNLVMHGHVWPYPLKWLSKFVASMDVCSEVTKSSNETKLQKMTSHLELLTQKFL